jgi:hypothetical protein
MLKVVLFVALTVTLVANSCLAQPVANTTFAEEVAAIHDWVLHGSKAASDVRKPVVDTVSADAAHSCRLMAQSGHRHCRT